MKRYLVAAAAGLALTLTAPGANAVEITLLCSNALKSVLEELGPQFEKASGHKLKMKFGTTGPLQVQIEKGEAFDVAILGVGATDALIRQGKLAASTRTDIARSGMGVAIRKGAPRPDISSIDAFKQTMLAARSVAYNEAGITGSYLKDLFQRLGLSEALKAKTQSGRGAEMVGEGKAEIGLTQVSEILPVAGAELAGPLPPELQQYTVFPAALSAAAIQAEAGQALLKFLKSPDAAKVLKAKGLEPAA